MNPVNKYLNFFIFFTVFVLYQVFFLKFFPNKNELLGHDFEQFLPNFIYGKIWFQNNFLSIPWFTPSFCCGTPFYPDPQTAFYSVQQIFYILFEPLTATKVLFIYFSLLGYCGMFFLLRRSFKVPFLISLLGSAVFIFNGFYVSRAIVGHVPYMNFILIPLYCFFLFEGFSNKSIFTRNIYLILSALILSSFIYSGAGPIMPLILLSILSVLLFFYFQTYNLKDIFLATLKSFFIAILISSSKISASIHYLTNFERKLLPTYFENPIDYLNIIFKALFFSPDIKFFNDVIMNKNIKGFGLHEIEFGVSILPLLLLVLFLYNIKYFLENKNFVKVLFSSIIIFSIPLILNTNFFYIQKIWNSIPIFGSSWTQFRWSAFYIIPLIFFIVVVLKNIKFTKHQNFLVICLLVVLFLQNSLRDRSYYDNQPYNPKNMIEFSNKINSDKYLENISITGFASFMSKDEKLANNLIRNDFFMSNYSAAFCYQPIFGYGLEKFPYKNIVFNKKEKISSDTFLISGDLDAAKDKTKYNFLNPSCFVFSKENDCLAGDLFKKSQKKELENFLNYKSFKFNKSIIQNFFDYLSLISLILMMILILVNFYFYKKKASRNSPF